MNIKTGKNRNRDCQRPLSEESLMRLAIREARRNLTSPVSAVGGPVSPKGGPFGACIVKGKKILAVARNTVLAHDATCHAEINAIRIASRKLKTFDLSGCVIYSTTEPCPMCFSAIHWARIKKIVYGTTTADAARVGFNELKISDARLKGLGKSRVILERSRLVQECEQLFADWEVLPQKKFY